MTSKHRHIAAAIAAFVVFSVTQVYVGVSFAGSNAVAPTTSRVLPQQVTGVLATQGNKPITVNGASAITGATIVSGAMIETPDGVSSTVALAGLGSLQMEPNTKLVLEFQPGSIKVTLIQGCVTLHTKKGTLGEIKSAKGGGGKTDPTKDDTIKTCPDVPAGVAGGGLGSGAILLIVGGGLAAVIGAIALGGGSRGANPSPSGL